MSFLKDVFISMYICVCMCLFWVFPQTRVSLCTSHLWHVIVPYVNVKISLKLPKLWIISTSNKAFLGISFEKSKD